MVWDGDGFRDDGGGGDGEDARPGCEGEEFGGGDGLAYAGESAGSDRDEDLVELFGREMKAGKKAVHGGHDVVMMAGMFLDYFRAEELVCTAEGDGADSAGEFECEGDVCG